MYLRCSGLPFEHLLDVVRDQVELVQIFGCLLGCHESTPSGQREFYISRRSIPAVENLEKAIVGKEV